MNEFVFNFDEFEKYFSDEIKYLREEFNRPVKDNVKLLWRDHFGTKIMFLTEVHDELLRLGKIRRKDEWR